MTGMAEKVRKEIEESKPPRRVGLRHPSECKTLWFMNVFASILVLMLCYAMVKCLTQTFAYQDGLPVQGQINRTYTTYDKYHNAHYHMAVGFTDRQNVEHEADFSISPGFYGSAYAGTPVPLHYLPAVPDWAVWDADLPSDSWVVRAFYVLVVLLVLVILPLAFLLPAYRLFKYGQFLKGTIEDYRGGRGASAQVSFMQEGHYRTKRFGVNSTAGLTKGQEVAVVAMPGPWGRARAYFDGREPLFRVIPSGPEDAVSSVIE